MVSLSPFEGEDDMIGRTRDADALVVSSARVTRAVMSALEGLKVVVRTASATTSSTCRPRPSWA
jgi:phosphoglycerate dehydrogenase-like enzyme